MKIYTRAGDHGTTALLGGRKVAKCDAHICAVGTLDELNALLGVARAGKPQPQIDDVLLLLQNQLFDLGAELANPQADKPSTAALQDNDIAAIENRIDTFEKDLPALTTFILPGGCQTAATLHLARCVCRRAEREIVALSQEATVQETVLKYINRISDLLFVLARSANAAVGVSDVAWKTSR
ncbi:MAG: cob(I)yrinic acid a,c-diamide adenosyltransferase [Planctomycetes bacterium]|nr:cob(I)yrinic acid a,c-diamide adenosyltransferase [Planctomycetota bacterium]